MVCAETSKVGLGARSTRPGHQRSGSALVINVGARGEGNSPDVLSYRKLKAVDMHVRRCAYAWKIGYRKIVFRGSNAAIVAGADSSALSSEMWYNVKK
ncbi:hypothetical protein IEQ34_003376 [Dendrobium chrysotoxum]|uniref:Uncharacterized protein n=1 Tax=Dendrobium chrysotoxum TaxID=161865 RepID=A0AAV7HJT0_DENCH|nr:hypothetical protein IEQ34_003376 [Dendrobium chrysotoxum]